MLRPSTAALTTVTLLALAACTPDRAATLAPPAPTPSSTAAVPRPSPQAPRVHAQSVAAALVSYGSCRNLVRSLRREALSEVTAYGLGSLGYPMGVSTGGMPIAMAAAAPGGTAASGGTTGGGAAGYSTTNNQEAGVDEPDLVKTDGHVMVVAQGNPSILRVLDVDGARPRLVGHLHLTSDSGVRLLLIGTTVVALSERYDNAGAVTVADVVSIADPARPHRIRTFSVQGTLLDARLVHERVVLVTQSGPTLVFTSPRSGSPADEASALRANRRIVLRSRAQDWLPAVRVSSRARGYRADCAQALHPGVASGTATTSIVTLDPDAARPTQNLTVVGGSSILYASTSAMYLATTSWRSQQLLAQGRGDRVTTDLHGFDLTDPDHLRFLGSCSVEGSLTDQYSLSESNGYLRVATTLGDPVPPVGEGVQPAVGRLSDNRVTVLQPRDGVLVKVGEVRGLGRGQRIFGVRFLGDVGYVVTFRTIDPLYVIDLVDPRHPRVRGALHISGYSSALYPLADGQLLGVGQAVGDHQQPLGAQLEVFDVRHLSRPRLTGKVVVRNSSSLAADDHHSLLWWAPARLVVVPLNSYDGQSFNGSVIYRVGTRGTLTEVGRVSAVRSAGTQCCWSGVQRSVVVGDLLYSLTESGLITNPIDEVDQQTWLPFP